MKKIRVPKRCGECHACGRTVELTIRGKLKSHSVGGLTGARIGGHTLRFKLPRCSGSGCDPRRT